MPIPASLSKLKSLFPVIVVGASVAITIKLLTESTPLTSNLLQVKAEEDIFSPEYQEILEDPKEPEPPTPEPEPQEPTTEQSNEPKEDEGSDEELQDSSTEQDNSTQEPQDSAPKEEKKEDPPKSAPKLKFKDDNFMGGFLKRIFKP
ncbi:hypothetical protein A6V39_03305 [Candidatus Mycoplasma haematobovis]|uniref:Uncharacterized protein n=1 Tax=Candidatus Mycoplasma haematobovis TaxID=432608 RepID=A0A1A9QBE9_9MOLU|nr:hypothetical protein [Candidatus Mycoplasma haematobovis]OAL09912.1 hypothetical protein A6V39_03305 [Candidatus Mycoplasma haematobovis]